MLPERRKNRNGRITGQPLSVINGLVFQKPNHSFNAFDHGVPLVDHFGVVDAAVTGLTRDAVLPERHHIQYQAGQIGIHSCAGDCFVQDVYMLME